MSVSNQYKEINNWIRLGMATILWGDAWATHVEYSYQDPNDPGNNNGPKCHDLAGKEITEIMPEIPKMGWQFAYILGCEYKKINLRDSVVDLFVSAMRAENPDLKLQHYDKALEDHVDDGVLPLRFGQCLAYMSLGYGVSWFDEYAPFTIYIPHIETSSLEEWASNNCEKCNENRNQKN